MAEEKRKNEKHLQTIDGETLMSTPLEEIKMIVDGFIPQGLHFLGGAPKTGKSWLVLWLCLQISVGEKIWDFTVKQGTTLYLCLEDSLSRIQNRLFDITETAPDNIHFAIMSETIGGGLIQQIEEFIFEHPDTNFIAIDTLQRVRNPPGDSSAYANDYKDINVLKAVVDKYNIAILLVHHLRKQGDDDPMNMISGTTGLTGAVDGISDDTEEDFSFSADHSISEVIEFLKSEEIFIGTATELAEKIKTETLPNILAKKLVQNQDLLLKNRIEYSSSRTGKKREISLLLNSNNQAADSGDGNDGNDSKNGSGSV